MFVHGTGAAGEEVAAAGETPRWWQPESKFELWLSERLRGPLGQPLLRTGLVYRFRWSGLNSEAAREEAARSLLGDLTLLTAEGRSVHLLAHSHGGNVARRAIELAEERHEGSDIRVASVTSFGTPFFHYSWVRLLAAAVGYFVISLIAFAGSWMARDWLTDVRLVLGANVGGFAVGLLYLVLAANALSALVGTARKPDGPAAAGWRNFHAGRDEAISLLMSLNRPIYLMRLRGKGRWMGGPLGCAFIAVAGFCLFLLALFALDASSSGADHSSDADDVIGIMIMLGIVGLGIAALLAAFDSLVDILVTARLRSIAFGDDAGNGIARVERYPWRGFEHCAVQIGADLEDAMEQHVASNTGLLWARIRGGLSPNAPLSARELKQAVENALTGDELSHTVYYHVPAFADLLAARLAATGDWLLVGAGRPDGLS